MPHYRLVNSVGHELAVYGAANDNDAKVYGRSIAGGPVGALGGTFTPTRSDMAIEREHPGGWQMVTAWMPRPPH